MSVPRSVRSITLTAQYTKAFLRMLEHPPDAHRGFDVPAAVVTVGDVPPVDNTTDSSSGSSSGGSDSVGNSSARAWSVVVAPGAPAADELQRATPLMVQLKQQRPPLVREESAQCDCSTECSTLTSTAWGSRGAALVSADAALASRALPVFYPASPGQR
jgi:hypothetical protein